jgi:hypothetical protein
VGEVKYFWLSSKDQYYNNWIFFKESSSKGVQLRERYQGLCCPLWRCRKFDELVAIQLGIEPDVKIQSRSDFLTTNDGLICVSQKVCDVISQHGIVGFRLVKLPGDERYTIGLPSLVAETDLDTSGMEFHGQCPNCGRYRETCLCPITKSMKLPTNSRAIICPSVNMESTRGREFWYLTTKEVVDIFRKHKLSGVEYIEAY